VSTKILGSRMRRPRLSTGVLVFASLLVLALGVAGRTFASPGSDWAMIGFDPTNSRDQPNEHDISTANVSQLAVKWTATTLGDVSATPAVVDGAVYFPDTGGMLWKLNAATGAVIWSNSISYYTGVKGDTSRTSPVLDGNTLLIGDLNDPTGANIMGIDATTGTLEWIEKADPDPHSIMTGSPVLVGDTAFWGTSQSGTPTYPGALVAFDALTGTILWRSYSLPNPSGTAGDWSGAVMFGSPSVDVQDGLVFAGFKMYTSEPASVASCNAAAASGFSESCEPSGTYFSSLVAFDMTTGDVVWSYRVFGPSAYAQACGSLPAAVTWCPAESDNVSFDIGGSAPNVFQLDGRTVVGIGQKSGVYTLLDAKTGAFIWATLVGPGGDQGGMEWGTAYDGSRIYVSITNQHHIPYDLTENGVLTNTVATGGSWAALDPATGKILWQVADPQTESVTGFTSPVGVWDLGPVSVANGVDYVSSMAQSGSDMYALDAATGQILWQYSAGSSVNASPAVVDGSLYWGTGYAKSKPEGDGNTKFFSFSIGGVSDTTPPTTTITLTPTNPNGLNGWYTSPVAVTVGATDNAGGSGVYQTRCALDPATVPTSFSDLPATGCSLTSVAGDGAHTIYAASEDNDNNVESPLVVSNFKIDQTPPTVTISGDQGTYSLLSTVDITCSAVDNPGGSGVASSSCGSPLAAGPAWSFGAGPHTVSATATDNAGNVSAAVLAKFRVLVDGDDLCTLTGQFVDGSARYLALRPFQRAVVNALVRLGCSQLNSPGPRFAERAPQGAGPRLGDRDRRAPTGAYDQSVRTLADQGFLTEAQADTLQALAAALGSGRR
jgi:polyvinyl alcohol dehydrogenase (cytochrome)